MSGISNSGSAMQPDRSVNDLAVSQQLDLPPRIRARVLDQAVPV